MSVVIDGTTDIDKVQDGVVGADDLSAEDTNCFRLTLTSGTPVTTADVTGATTIYCTPYKGKRISLYTGTAWVVRQSNEFSLALGTLTASLPYDVFCYDNAGVPTLEFLAWSSATTRATALAYQDGVLVKSGAATRRYLGTFYTTSTTATEDSASSRYLWNYYHRVDRNMVRVETTATWAYTTATIRQANASVLNQLNFVIGVAEDNVIATVVVGVVNSDTNGAVCGTGIGLDSTTVRATGQIHTMVTANNNRESCVVADYKGTPSAGKHYLSWLEYSQAIGATNWYGNSGGTRAAGIVGTVKS